MKKKGKAHFTIIENEHEKAIIKDEIQEDGCLFIDISIIPKDGLESCDIIKEDNKLNKI